MGAKMNKNIFIDEPGKFTLLCNLSFNSQIGFYK